MKVIPLEVGYAVTKMYVQELIEWPRRVVLPLIEGFKCDDPELLLHIFFAVNTEGETTR